MKLSELLQQLVEIAQAANPDHDDIIGSELEVDPEIRIAMQPSWPMESHVLHARIMNSNGEYISDIEGILKSELTESERGEASEELNRLKAENEIRIYLVEGSHIGYASKNLWDSAD